MLVLALQECGKGSAEPFVVCMDHKNLAYLCRAKPSAGTLGSLSRMLHLLTYLLGSKKTCIMGVVTWQVEECVHEAQCSTVIPGRATPEHVVRP